MDEEKKIKEEVILKDSVVKSTKELLVKLKEFWLNRFAVSASVAIGQTRLISAGLAEAGLIGIESTLPVCDALLKAEAESEKNQNPLMDKLVANLKEAETGLKEDLEIDQLAVELANVPPHRKQHDKTLEFYNKIKHLLSECEIDLKLAPSSSKDKIKWFTIEDEEARQIKKLITLKKLKDHKDDKISCWKKLRELHEQSKNIHPEKAEKDSVQRIHVYYPDVTEIEMTDPIEYSNNLKFKSTSMDDISTHIAKDVPASKLSSEMIDLLRKFR